MLKTTVLILSLVTCASAASGVAPKRPTPAPSHQRFTSASRHRAHYVSHFWYEPWNWKTMLIGAAFASFVEAGFDEQMEQERPAGHYHASMPGWNAVGWDVPERGANVMKYSSTPWREAQLSPPIPVEQER
jgi:hypothetical protein